MKFNIKNYVIENIKELMVSGRMLSGVLVALFPAICMIATIVNSNNSTFYIKHVSNFYCMLGLIAAVLTSVYMINRDFSSNVISLIFNSKKNRLLYTIANVITTLIISILYSIIGILVCCIAKKIGVSGELKVSFLLGFAANFIIIILSYVLICNLLYLFKAKSSMIYTILTACILFLPNLVSNIVWGLDNEVINHIVENIPLYYYPIYAGSRPFSVLQYSIGGGLIVLMFCLVVKKSEKFD